MFKSSQLPQMASSCMASFIDPGKQYVLDVYIWTSRSLDLRPESILTERYHRASKLCKTVEVLEELTFLEYNERHYKLKINC